MTNPPTTLAMAPIVETEFEKLVDLFGGPDVLGQSVSSPIEAHEMILHGIPSQALESLVTHLAVIDLADAFENAFGMSERTFQRHKLDHSKTLSKEQGSRTWNFARTLTKATSVLGSQEEAEKWMIQPAMGLDNRRPIDLLATAAGTELVQEFLERLDYGVYA
ncbi:antitoxin Xre/MbcA/ParS toxin-binding domain-containing protein [Mesorhizobium sp. dw_380]|uniref:type II RES/Xre toxin-antitoxin system antitoxin n=1 Tax=Mesorhizobium sp. dw_380 TaxID=2812001 RepID=UPI001BDEBDDD|nr:antitoxin Xre/MbcA/ParS toxin-binding domain-containing protein [Mesorhizobium sp. dw_380]